jgi:hypothetical protein
VLLRTVSPFGSDQLCGSHEQVVQLMRSHGDSLLRWDVQTSCTTVEAANVRVQLTVERLQVRLYFSSFP